MNQPFLYVILYVYIWNFIAMYAFHFTLMNDSVKYQAIKESLDAR